MSLFSGSCSGVLVFVLILVIAVLLGLLHLDSDTRNHRNHKPLVKDEVSPSGVMSYRIPSNGIIVFTNAATGASREAAILLAESTGLQVIAGVKTKAELKSFAFEQQRGNKLEPFLLDIADQNTVLKFFYRIQELQSQYGREIVGVVIDGMESLSGSPAASRGASIDWSTELDNIDTFIKSGFRTTAKFIQVWDDICR
jgi:hypothetical protein